MPLTLSQKSFLSDVICRYRPDLHEQSYEIAGAFTEPQRSKFLRHYYSKENELTREMLSNIISFQTKILTK